jgi:hypothetical protein
VVSQDDAALNGELQRSTYVDFHLRIYPIVHNQAVRQPYSVRLHRMASDVGIVPNIGIVEVGNPLLATVVIQRRRVDGRE